MSGYEALATVFGTGVNAYSTYWATKETIKANTRAARIQAEEDSRIEALRIKFAGEESAREESRFSRSQAESARQFDTSTRQRDSQFGITQGENVRQFDISNAQQESQFARTHGISQARLDMDKEKQGIDKTQMIVNNRQAMRGNILNLFATNHKLRLDFADYYMRRSK